VNGVRDVTAFYVVLFSVEMLKDTSMFSVCCLHNIEKRKDSTESSTWALSNFLREVNQSKENTPASKNVAGKLSCWHFVIIMLMFYVCVSVCASACAEPGLLKLAAEGAQTRLLWLHGQHCIGAEGTELLGEWHYWCGITGCGF